jgi:UDP-4-amino-4,6-dideoxy-N-acetyl-beta-L-altrosamine transaminase
MKIIPYGRQNITQQDIDAVIGTLTDEFLTQGPKIHEFEEKFAAYVKANYAVAVANGTAALHLSALSLGVNPKSKVIVTPITFAASANCVRYCGGEVVFADVDPATILLDVAQVRDLLRQAPRGTYQGIIPVDFAGYPVNLELFRELADEFGLWIIEDACHAPGGYFIDSAGQRQMCGNGHYADLAIFSFHPVKHIACGEGGMITTNNKDLYEKLLLLRSHGISKDPKLMHENHGGWYYEMLELGFNYRLTDIQCALGISQLNRAGEGLIRRQEIARRYDKAFKNTSARCIVPNNELVKHAYHLYIIRVANRKELYDRLKQRGIYAQIHYVPLHRMPYYQKIDQQPALPAAESYYEECISLPMYPSLKDDDQQYVIDTVLENIK